MLIHNGQKARLHQKQKYNKFPYPKYNRDTICLKLMSSFSVDINFGPLLDSLRELCVCVSADLLKIEFYLVPLFLQDPDNYILNCHLGDGAHIQ